MSKFYRTAIIKKEPRVGYAVTLADGRQLTFDTKGQLIPACPLPINTQTAP